MIPSPVRIVTVLGVLLFTLFISARLGGSRDLSTSVVLESLPNKFADSTAGQWNGSPSEGLGVREIDILKLDQWIKRYYSLTGSDTSDAAQKLPVNAYVGYWKNQTGDSQGAKHSPSICLPSSGWIVEQRGTKEFTLKTTPPTRITARQVIGSIMGHRALFTYWFFSAGDTYFDEWKALIYISFSSLFKGRTDGGIVTISVPFQRNLPDAEAEKLAELVTSRFVETFAGKLSEVLEASNEKAPN